MSKATAAAFFGNGAKVLCSHRRALYKLFYDADGISFFDFNNMCKHTVARYCSADKDSHAVIVADAAALYGAALDRQIYFIVFFKHKITEAILSHSEYEINRKGKKAIRLSSFLILFIIKTTSP